MRLSCSTHISTFINFSTSLVAVPVNDTQSKPNLRWKSIEDRIISSAPIHTRLGETLQISDRFHSLVQYQGIRPRLIYRPTLVPISTFITILPIRRTIAVHPAPSTLRRQCFHPAKRDQKIRCSTRRPAIQRYQGQLLFRTDRVVRCRRKRTRRISTYDTPRGARGSNLNRMQSREIENSQDPCRRRLNIISTQKRTTT